MDLKSKSILLAGQLFTSRTDTIEEYLKERVEALGVIGIVSAFASENLSRCSLYENGELRKEFKVPSMLIKKRNIFGELLLIPVFILYFISILRASFRFRRKFDIFLGVACFSTFVGIFLKRLGRVKRVIYYCIDYYQYPNPKRPCFNTLVVWTFRQVDKFCVKNSDIVWHISRRIPEARQEFERVRADSYQHIVVPLCYGSKLMREVPFEDIERWTIGFVGTLSPNQGLQLLINAMPQILKQLPNIKLKIIGKGPYEEELKKQVRLRCLDSIIEFLGFIKDENEVLDILSHCTVGVALWPVSKDDNIYYADTGKPKLYAFCGLPIIITKGTSISDEIERRKAGITINYDRDELRNAILKLFKNESLIIEYKQNSFELAKSFTSEIILDKALMESSMLNL